MSMIGRIIDMEYNEFVREIQHQNCTVGVLCNLKLYLINSYEELRLRKNSLIDQVNEDKLKSDQVTDVIKGIYSEMLKIETKVIYIEAEIKRIMLETESD